MVLHLNIYAELLDILREYSEDIHELSACDKIIMVNIP